MQNKKKIIFIVIISIIFLGSTFYALNFSTKNRVRNGIQKDLLSTYELDHNNPPKVQASNPREAYALLVGVNDYPGDENDLEYCVNDVNAMSYFLQNQFNIDGSHIQTLLNSEATESNIISEIQEYSSIVDENDYLLFYYSGHGTASISDPISHSYSVNSPHPYPNYYDRYWYISEPDAFAIRVHFTKIQTEYGYDGVFVGDGYQTDYAYDLFTGDYTDVWSSWVISNKLYFELYTDESMNDWGFEVDKYEVLNFIQPSGLYPYSSDPDAMLTGSELKSALDSVSGTQICILDSCNSGGVGEELAGSNRLVMCASKLTEFSLEDEGLKNGVFTNKFIDSWDSAIDSNRDGFISFEEAFSRCYSLVLTTSQSLGYPFHPQMYDGINGDLILTPSISLSSFSHQENTNYLLISGSHIGLGSFSIEMISYDFETQKIESQVIDDDFLYSQFSFNDYELDISSSILLNDIDIIFIEISLFHNGEESSLLFYVIINLEMERVDIGSIIDSTYPDFDRDGLPDVLEVIMEYDPTITDSDKNSIDDGSEDFDNDGLSNLNEINYHTNVFLKDSDGDNFYDGYEVEKGTNPTSKISNPTTRKIFWGSFLLVIVAFSSILYIKKGKYVVQKKRKIKQKEKQYRMISYSFPSNLALNKEFNLKKEIERIQVIYQMKNPILFEDPDLFRICSPYHEINILPLESYILPTWNWEHDYFQIKEDSSLEITPLILVAPFSHTIIKELQLFHGYYLNFSLQCWRTVLYLVKTKLESLLQETNQTIDDNITSPFLKTLKYNPVEYYASLLELGKSLSNYSELSGNFDKYWSDKNYSRLHSLIYSKISNNGQSLQQIAVITWLFELSLEDPLFKEILPPKYHKMKTFGDLFQEVCKKNPAVPREYIERFYGTYKERIEIQKTKDKDKFIHYIKKNIELDSLNLNDWLDLASIYTQLKEIEKADKCYRVALAINPYSHKIWGNLVPPKPSPKSSYTSNSPSRSSSYSSSSNYYSTRHYSPQPRYNNQAYVPTWLKPNTISPDLSQVALVLYISIVSKFQNLGPEDEVKLGTRAVIEEFLNNLPQIDPNITPTMLRNNLERYRFLLSLKIPIMIAYAMKNSR